MPLMPASTLASPRSTWMRVAVLLLVGLGLSGCYSRAKLKAKHTPAQTKIYSKFNVKQSLINNMAAQLKEIGGSTTTIQIGRASCRERV